MDKQPATEAPNRRRGEPADRVDVKPAPWSLKRALRDLLTAYLDEFAASEGVPPRPRDDAGNATYRWFDEYWTNPTRTPLAIWVGDALAGFCFLYDAEQEWRIAEFYVAPAFRRQRVGMAAVAAIKQHCLDSEKHALLEANTLVENTRALAFWRSQGFVTVSKTPERLINVFRLRP